LKVVQFAIDTAAGIPIYQQLIEQIHAAIARGRLQANERLPSVRELSQTLVVNPNTVARTYTELERAGTLYTRPGMGVFVCPRPELSSAAREERLRKPLAALLVDAARLGCASREVLEMVQGQLDNYAWHEPARQAVSEQPTL
jgi:GntR family transcriptional regulator